MASHFCNIYKSGNLDCTNNGVTAYRNHILLFTDLQGAQNASKNGPVLVLIARDQFNDKIAVPLGDNGRPRMGGMFGGNFIYSSDSRFNSEVANHPIKVHDRFES